MVLKLNAGCNICILLYRDVRNRLPVPDRLVVIWWTVGIYSHNIVTDWLAEGGIIGTILLFMMFFKMSNWIRKKASHNTFFVLLAFILIKNLLESCVSGYWFAVGVYWLFFGYYYTKKQMGKLLA